MARIEFNESNSEVEVLYKTQNKRVNSWVDKVRKTPGGDLVASYKGSEEFRLKEDFNGWKASANDSVWVKVDSDLARRLEKEAIENQKIEFLDDEV